MLPPTPSSYFLPGTPSNPVPSITSFSPSNPTPSSLKIPPPPFSLTTDQQVNSTWYLNGANQNNNTQAWSHTWDTEGQYNVTYMGSNGNGSVSILWNVVTCSPLDVNCDGKINKADLGIIKSNFGRITYAPYPRYDVTRYGIVDVYDITVVSTNISEGS